MNSLILLFRIYKKPSSIALHATVIVVVFVLFSVFEYLYGGGLNDLFHTHEPIETMLLFLTLFLLGLLVVLYVASFEKQRTLSAGRGVSSVAALGSVIGMGCVSCGTALLASIASLLGFSGFLLALPFAGREIQVLGVVFLGLASLILLKRLGKPPICLTHPER